MTPAWLQLRLRLVLERGRRLSGSTAATASAEGRRNPGSWAVPSPAPALPGLGPGAPPLPQAAPPTGCKPVPAIGSLGFWWPRPFPLCGAGARPFPASGPRGPASFSEPRPEALRFCEHWLPRDFPLASSASARLRLCQLWDSGRVFLYTLRGYGRPNATPAPSGVGPGLALALFYTCFPICTVRYLALLRAPLTWRYRVSKVKL